MKKILIILFLIALTQPQLINYQLNPLKPKNLTQNSPEFLDFKSKIDLISKKNLKTNQIINFENGMNNNCLFKCLLSYLDCKTWSNSKMPCEMMLFLCFNCVNNNPLLCEERC